MRLRLAILCLSLLSLIASPGLQAADPAPLVKADGSLDLDVAVKYFEDLYRSDSSVSEASMTVRRPRQERTLKMTIWTEGMDKSLVLIEDPPREAGTATLKVDQNLWNYLPRIKRTIRIPPSMMLSSWMGSDLTNDDMVREASFSEDYTYELVGKSTEPEGWLLRFTAKAGAVGLWKRFDLVVSPDGRVPIHSAWYDRKDELARVMDWSNVQTVDGKRIPMTLRITPKDQDEAGHETVIEYARIDFGVELPSGTFSLSRLERQR